MRVTWTAGIAVAAVATLTPSASADMVALVRGPSTVVVYESAPGAQPLEVRALGLSVNLRGSRITAGPGCRGTGRVVRCRIQRRRGAELRVDLGEGSDRLRAIVARMPMVVRGGPGNDRIETGSADDYVEGGDGNDRLTGDLGADRLLGGAGDDRLIGASGHDRLYGGIGDDLLFGRAGNDLLNPGQGADQVYGDSGADRIRVRDTPPVYDRLDCGSGRDRVVSRDRADHRGVGCERRRRSRS